MTLEKIVNRAAEYTGIYGVMRTTPGRVDALALATLSAQAADQQLDLFARWCYQRHAGLFVNIQANGQIARSWAPWGSSGKSGMSKPDRRILRAWLIGLAERRHFPPWIYDETINRWFVDLVRYADEADCLRWLGRHRINPKDWLAIQLAMRG